MQLYPAQPVMYADDDTFMLYTMQWVSVLTQLAGTPSDVDLAEGSRRIAEAVSTCQQYFVDHFKGKIALEHASLNVEKLGDDIVVRLELFMPTLLGEFTTLAQANRHRSELAAHGGYTEIEIVTRGSAREKQITGYGAVMLPQVA